MFSFSDKNRKEAKKRLKEVFQEKGFYCDEYVKAFIESRRKLTSDDHLTLCEIYTEMGRYDEAQKELLQVRPGSILDDIATGQNAFCQIHLFLEMGEYDKAISVYNEKVTFMDVFFKNPARSRAAGDYYCNAATLCAILSVTNPSFTMEKAQENIERYYARLREWCDTFPRNRILYEITRVRVLYAWNKEEAGEAADTCRQTVLDFGFEHEWEREYYLKKLDRAAKLRDAEIPEESLTHEE